MGRRRDRGRKKEKETAKTQRERLVQGCEMEMGKFEGGLFAQNVERDLRPWETLAEMPQEDFLRSLN